MLLNLYLAQNSEKKMSNSFEKYQKRRLRSSYFSVIISIALVMFLLGLVGLLVLKTKSISAHFKEQVAITVFLNDVLEEEDILAMKTVIEAQEYTKSVSYISKEDAAKIYAEDIGEDFVNYLGYNPLKNALDVYVKSNFVTPAKMIQIERDLAENNDIFEISYDKPLINLLTQNIQKISFWILLFSGLFMLIAVVLINSAIRLSIYSKRFTIKTMQMVGATKGFIRKPFLWQGVRLGVLGSLVAIAGVVVAIYYIQEAIPEINFLEDKEILGVLFVGIILVGIVITFFSTYLATRRFLNLRTEELYY